ncbi:hypothetical protein D3C71_1247370 [compost metagenome]
MEINFTDAAGYLDEINKNVTLLNYKLSDAIEILYSNNNLKQSLSQIGLESEQLIKEVENIYQALESLANKVGKSARKIEDLQL